MQGTFLGEAGPLLAAEGVERAEEEEGAGLHAYLTAYAAGARNVAVTSAEPQQVLQRLQGALEDRLALLGPPGRAAAPLYVELEELPHHYLRVDFELQLVEHVPWVSDPRRYALRLPVADVLPVLDGIVAWDDLLSSLRQRLGAPPLR
ncbi:hypothetical protein FGE12_21965 [Aggregicoccus sp. 17bor-14]|uniref:hypothetical protein n=1 Tax=Myxococcaceae TaxID=31 RepID=UPI00129CB7A1|nr:MULTISPECIES: hypothetical protein [Myxococcaceae]MBF5045084.1 hypothetical protein [Simulacricoccus sp. 17bor-14]MRI90826.1 hypothetical protein [Aggregicoccus sp. 17bor-14]